MKKLATMVAVLLVSAGVLTSPANAEVESVGMAYSYEGTWYTGWRWDDVTATMGSSCHRVTGPGNVARSFRNRSSHYIDVYFTSGCDIYGGLPSAGVMTVPPWTDKPYLPWSGGFKSIRRH